MYLFVEDILQLQTSGGISYTNFFFNNLQYFVSCINIKEKEIAIERERKDLSINPKNE